MQKHETYVPEVGDWVHTSSGNEGYIRTADQHGILIDIKPRMGGSYIVHVSIKSIDRMKRHGVDYAVVHTRSGSTMLPRDTFLGERALQKGRK